MKITNNMNINNSRGFTLIELMIVVAIIGILAAIAYPSYQQYVIKTKRADMMTELQNIATQIQSRKLAQGKYSNTLVTGLGGDYPIDNPLYEVTFTDPLTSQWVITAEPIDDTQMNGDGNLTLNSAGQKCRATKCGTSDEWR